MHFLQAINSDVSALTVCNKTGGTIKGDIKKYAGFSLLHFLISRVLLPYRTCSLTVTNVHECHLEDIRKTRRPERGRK